MKVLGRQRLSISTSFSFANSAKLLRPEARNNSSAITGWLMRGFWKRRDAPGAKDFQEDTLSDTSAARKPVDVSDVWGGVQNRFKNAAADRTSNPLFYDRSQRRRRFEINSSPFSQNHVRQSERDTKSRLSSKWISMSSDVRRRYEANRNWCWILLTATNKRWFWMNCYKIYCCVRFDALKHRFTFAVYQVLNDIKGRTMRCECCQSGRGLCNTDV